MNKCLEFIEQSMGLVLINIQWMSVSSQVKQENKNTKLLILNFL